MDVRAGRSENPVAWVIKGNLKGKVFLLFSYQNLGWGGKERPTALDVSLGAMNRGKILFFSNLSESETCSL